MIFLIEFKQIKDSYKEINKNTFLLKIFKFRFFLL